jgi:hypothetical protein
MAYANLIDGDGSLYETRQAYTDRDGYFLLSDMPSGALYTVYIQYGDEILDTHEVNVRDGEAVILEEPACFDPVDLNVAVITGDYDGFAAVLGHMGFENYTLIDGLIGDEIAGFLTNLDAMREYDMIFFNGGHIEEGLIYPELDGDDGDGGTDSDSVFDTDTDADADEGSACDGGSASEEDEPTPASDAHEAIIANIRNYVAAGGAVYASDWAYDVVERTWPEAINFVGDDSLPNDAQRGEGGIVRAQISDGALAGWLATDEIEITYDLPVWPPIEGIATEVAVHLRGDIEYRIGDSGYSLSESPLLVSFASGDGQVVFSTFRVAQNAEISIMLTLQYLMYSL